MKFICDGVASDSLFKVTKAPAKFARNPRSPVPYFVSNNSGAYAYACSGYGLDVLGDTPFEATKKWQTAVSLEDGRYAP